MQRPIDCDKSLQTLMRELGHKMPLYCKSLLHPSHDIINYLQFTHAGDTVDQDLLPVERVLSPFLVLVVCEKIYREYSQLDHCQTRGSCGNASESIYAFYNQVLTDFDCLISLLNGVNDNLSPCAMPAATKDAVTAPTHPATNLMEDSCALIPNKASCTVRLHRRTIQIIEDFCTLIGMRLAILDVLNILDKKDTAPEVSANKIRTLDRIIACAKCAHSKHTLPLIERAALEAKAIRTYIFSRKALLASRYAEATILIFDFKQLLKALEVTQPPRLSYRPVSCPDKATISCTNTNTNQTNTNINESEVPMKSNTDCSEIADDIDIRNSANVPELGEVISDKISITEVKGTMKHVLLESLQTKLKIMHSIVFKENLEHFSSLVGDDNDHISPKMEESPFQSVTDLTAYITGMTESDTGQVEGQSSGVQNTRVSSASISSSTSDSSDYDNNLDENSRYDFSKENTQKRGSITEDSHRRPHTELSLSPMGFVCPPRAEWGEAGVVPYCH